MGIRYEEVYWVLRASEAKNPVRVLDDILQMKNGHESGEYLGHLNQVKKMLDYMEENELVDVEPMLNRDGAQVEDSYGPVWKYRLNSDGMASKPKAIVWERKL